MLESTSTRSDLVGSCVSAVSSTLNNCIVVGITTIGAIFSLNSSVPSHSPLPPLIPCVYAMALTATSFIVTVGSVVSAVTSSTSITGSQVQYMLSSSSAVISVSSLFFITKRIYLSVASAVNSKSALAKLSVVVPLYALEAV